MLNRSANEHYLRSTVMTASPARLRLMLLDRAVALTVAIEESRLRRPEVLIDEQTLTLRGILGELLNGVARKENALAAQVADLYVFLLQELTWAEQEPGVDRIRSIGTILEIEQETWRQVCEMQVQRAAAVNQNPAGVPAPAMSRVSGIPAGPNARPSSGALNFSA